MKMNRNYYKQGQSNRLPYIMVIIIISLLWIMNGIYEDTKDTNKMYNELIKEFHKKDSLVNNDSLKVNYEKKVDSLITVVDWYKNQYKKNSNKITYNNNKRVETKKDSI